MQLLNLIQQRSFFNNQFYCTVFTTNSFYIQAFRLKICINFASFQYFPYVPHINPPPCHRSSTVQNENYGSYHSSMTAYLPACHFISLSSQQFLYSSSRHFLSPSSQYLVHNFSSQHSYKVRPCQEENQECHLFKTHVEDTRV